MFDAEEWQLCVIETWGIDAWRIESSCLVQKLTFGGTGSH